MAKSKYETHVQPKLMLVEAWARDGLTLDQIAHNLGIHRDTLNEYKNRYSDLSDSLKSGKDEADIEVENALFRNATGYHYKEQVATPSGMVVEVEKYAHPNTTAQIFWLKNRRPAQWRDKQDVEHSGPDGQPMQVVWSGGMPRPKVDDT
jgi:hypothetical protein